MANVDFQIQTSNSNALTGTRALITQMRSLQQGVFNLNSALDRNTASTTANTTAMGRLSNSARQAGSAFSQARSPLESFNRGVGQLKALIAGGIVLRLGTDITDTALKMRGAVNALTALTGSAALSHAQLAKLDNISSRVGYRTLDLTKSYVKLQGAVAGTTLEGQAAEKLFENLARATALYGGTTDDLDGSLNAITQMASKGVVQMEELKGQLGDRLPGALRIAADAMGMTTAQLTEFIKAGKLDADTFIRKFADELGRRVPANFESARAGISRFQNQMDKAKLSFAESGFLDGVTEGLTSMSAVVKQMTDDGTLKELGQDVGAVMKFMAENIGTIAKFAAALVALNVAGSLATSLTAIAGALRLVGVTSLGAAGGMVALRTAMAFLTGPWGIAILGISAAVAALAASQGKAVQPTKAVQAATENLDKALKGYEETAAKAAIATGKEREELIKSLTTKRQAIEHEKTLAEAKLKTARATLAAAQAEATSALTSNWGGAGAAAEGANMGRANAASRTAKRASADIQALEANIKKASDGLADLDRSIKALSAPKTDLGGGSGKGDGGKAAKDAANATKQYTEELKRLKVAADLATMSERDQAAMQALESAGLQQNIKATDERSKAIIRAAYAAYDAKQAFDDKKKADELDIELANRHVQAQNDLLALTNPALAASKQAIASANQEYDATVRQIEAMKGLTEARREELKAKAAQTRDTAINTANQEVARNQTDYGRDVGRGLEDALLDRKAITDPKNAELERQRLEVQRRREDALRQLGDSIDKESEEYRRLVEVINRTADIQLENIEQSTKQNKVVSTIEQMSDLFGGMFTNTEETMKQFFAQLISQLLKTIAYALIMKTTMAGAFNAMGGGGGLAGIIVGAIFGARAQGGPISANKPYLVGEKGPEVILPGRSGTVIPNNALKAANSNFSMGDMNTHITINNAQGMNEQSLSTAVVEKQKKMLENIVDQRLRDRRIA